MSVHLTLDNEALANAYDEISHSQFNKGRTLIEKLAVKDGDSVLDIGSGTGRLGRHVMTIIGQSGHFVGIDPLEERIKIASEKNNIRTPYSRLEPPKILALSRITLLMWCI